MYSIGEVAEIFHLPVSTLRYYDNSGLFPNIQRSESGTRIFNEEDLETLKMIECLKKSGMQLKDIKQFLDWCKEGNATLKKRRDMFVQKQKEVKNEIAELEKVLDLLTYKCWFYEEAIKDNSDERVRKTKIEDMPKEIQKAYKNSHI